MINAKLIVVGGARQTEVTLKKLPATIGRSKEASITLPHSLVSRQHCEIFEEQGILYVRDLNSLNGTFLNNERITGSRPLLPDQLLTLGNVTFRAFYDVPELDLAAIQQQAETNTWTDDNELCETIESEVLAVQVAQARRESIETDASDSSSNIRVVDDEVSSTTPSISLSSIDQLPRDEKSTIEDAKIDVEPDQSETVHFDSGEIQIDTGDDVDKSDPDDGSLGSFIRKLPK